MKDALIRFRRPFIATLLTFLMVGCETTRDSLTPANSALVIGHVTISQPLTKTPSSLRAFSTIVRFADFSSSRNVFNLAVNGIGGFFSFRLHPGSYAVFEVSFSELNWLGNPLKSTRQRLVATFEVPQNASAVYIGNLKLNVVDAAANKIETSGFWFSSIYGTANLAFGVQAEVTNDLELAIQDMRKFAPKEVDLTPVANVMQLEKPRPTAVLDTTLAGVKPLEPKPRPLGMWNDCLAKSLQPTLAWEPSKKPGVTYDLVVYTDIPVVSENSSWRYAAPGKEVYYREALDSNSHTLEDQLLPHTYYLWSVRTRVGTSVSGWSRLNIERLLSGNEGLYWGFTTP